MRHDYGWHPHFFTVRGVGFSFAGASRSLPCESQHLQLDTYVHYSVSTSANKGKEGSFQLGKIPYLRLPYFFCHVPRLLDETVEGNLNTSR